VSIVTVWQFDLKVPDGDSMSKSRVIDVLSGSSTVGQLFRANDNTEETLTVKLEETEEEALVGVMLEFNRKQPAIMTMAGVISFNNRFFILFSPQLYDSFVFLPQLDISSIVHNFFDVNSRYTKNCLWLYG